MDQMQHSKEKPMRKTKTLLYYIPYGLFGVNLSLSRGSDWPALFSAFTLATYSVPSVSLVSLYVVVEAFTFST